MLQHATPHDTTGSPNGKRGCATAGSLVCMITSSAEVWVYILVHVCDGYVDIPACKLKACRNILQCISKRKQYG